MINMKSNSVEIRPIDAETCSVMAIKFVPKGKDMPLWLLNFFMKRMGSYISKKFEDGVKKIDLDKLRKDPMLGPQVAKIE